jgi:hypothetical protein
MQATKLEEYVNYDIYLMSWWLLAEYTTPDFDTDTSVKRDLSWACGT